MASETDFLDLYRKLDLNPGCSLSEFKQAYRRHVGLLHPDRLADAHRQPSDSESLRKLIAQYGAAMEFHRRHGRLPGAAMPGRSVVADAGVHTPRAQPTSLRDTRPPRSLLLGLVVVLAMGVLLWNITPQAPEVAPAAASADGMSDAGPDVARVAGPSLSIGMSPESVRAIEGEPIDILGDRWEYGPSWISFEHDRVVDWYSSPLRSLRTAESRPRR